MLVGSASITGHSSRGFKRIALVRPSSAFPACCSVINYTPSQLFIATPACKLSEAGQWKGVVSDPSLMAGRSYPVLAPRFDVLFPRQAAPPAAPVYYYHVIIN